MENTNNGEKVELSSKAKAPPVNDKPGDDGVGSDGSEAPPCFIATAIYGTRNCEELDVFRKFRDENLLTNSIGRLFVASYYRIGPFIAEYLNTKPRMKIILKPAFDMMYRFLK